MGGDKYLRNPKDPLPPRIPFHYVQASFTNYNGRNSRLGVSGV